MINTIIKISFKRKTPKFSETRYNHIACVCGCWSREPTWNPLYLVNWGEVKHAEGEDMANTGF